MADYNNWERFYHNYNLIFNGIVAVPLLPFAYLFLETQKDFPDAPLVEGSINAIVSTMLIVIAAISVLKSQRIKKQVSERIKSVEGIKPKLDKLLSVKIRQYLVLQVAGFAGIVGLWLTKDVLFTILYLVVLFVFSLSRPTFDGVVREIGIDAEVLKNWGDENNAN